MISFDFVKMLPLNLQTIVYTIILIIGAVILIKSCDVFVDNSTLIAKKFRIPPLIIGLTIVAMGTSIPELAVSVSDSISVLKNGGSANIAVSNVVGSNMSNLLIVLSLSALFAPLKIKKESKKDYIIVIGVSILFAILSIFFGMGAVVGNYAILRFEALIFVFLIIPYLIYVVMSAKHEGEHMKHLKTYEKISIGKPILLVILMVATIAIGGEFVVEGAKGVSMNFSSVFGLDKDMAETLVGLTIVAVGTSLPELVTTVIAAKKRQNDMAVGNVIGSNIFNIIFVLGISGVVTPLTLTFATIIDILVMLFATILVFIFVLRGKLTRKHGIVLLSLYGAYVLYLILRTIMVF